MVLKVGNTIGDCLNYILLFIIFAIVKLDAEAGIGG
jgi:hypothetical protein